MRSNNEEKIISYLLQQKREDNPNEIYLGINSFGEVNDIKREDFISTILKLQDRNLISISFHGTADGNSPCHIMLHDTILSYFDNQKKYNKNKLRHITWEVLKFIIPVIISIIALIRTI